ncbi:MAG: hypothetical protein QME52_07535 [Bacteroidota bacterium]|nr:hypothetical protein [Bacteroidota bacterium]
MSLKVEQRLDNFFFTEAIPRIYTTGAYLVPMEIIKGGKKRLIWVVDQFQDDTFTKDGPCSPKVYAFDKQELIGQ